jgi:hypothetical protein
MLWRDICPYVPQITWVASNNQHYRHTSIDTTYRLYIAKNNIMKTQRFEARMRANGNGNGGGHTIGNGWVAVPAFSPQAAGCDVSKVFTISLNSSLCGLHFTLLGAINNGTT